MTFYAQKELVNPKFMRTCMYVLLTLVLILCIDTVLAEETNTAALRPSVRTVVNADRLAAYKTRLAAVKQLPKQLSEGERDVLVQFLYVTPESDTSVNEMDLAAIKNDLMSVFCTTQHAEIITPHMIAMSDMPQLGHIWNNYCIQFFTKLYPLVDKAQKIAIIKAYDRWLAQPVDLRAGTALISIKNVMAFSSDFTPSAVCDTAWRIYSADSVLEINKIAAFQILGDLADARILRESRRSLRTDTGDITYKMASMAILGKHGIADDLALLESYTKHADIRLRTAGMRNLKGLRTRLEKDQGLIRK